MKAEFMKDDNGFMWFFYAKNIHIRKGKLPGMQDSVVSKDEAKKAAQRKREEQEKAKQQLIQELDSFEKECSKRGGPEKYKPILKMMEFMERYYAELKEKQGIKEHSLEVHSTKVPNIEEVIQRLNPACDAKNFKELL